MRYERDLQVKLQERYRRLYKADYKVYDREIKYFYDFIQKSPALRAIAERVAQDLPELDSDKWVEDHFVRRGHYDWPESEVGRAKVTWRLITRWVTEEDPTQHVTYFSTDSNYNTMFREMTEKAIEPFVEYLQEQIGSASEILYMLERFTRRLEWFDQAELFDKYKVATKHGEDLYDQYLRKFLFDQGVDYPFSQPKSASGQADIVSGLEGDDPLVCEVKLYDPDRSYGVPYIAKGFQQAVSYAHNYGKDVAYLVIFNLSDQGLQWPNDEETKPWPPRLHVEGVTVYLVTAHAKPRPSASKRGKSSPRLVRRDELVQQTDA
ncbi:hypothetical protein [Streptomyces sp. NPDC057616]|uniref:hypothetical protein n=1 Tax=Streptomyces sp. NPDC057616 TaxID=3346183 RepID=UPI003674631D